MAEVESISVAVNLPTDVSQITTTTTTPTTTTTDAAESNAETGQSPTQERSSNSHPHDSEYDTATDLEGAEDYDDEENSITEDEDYDESDEERQKLLEEDGESSNAEKTVDGEAPKKVDEDRRNPQYIPKRGTFYEHDDREDEVAADAKTTKVLPTPASQPPKARKWQVIPSGDRWSHDRFDACEQAPKSAAELVSAYGYDIRNEEAPPRARRRRRYAKGPTRYQRNWEDENAYQRNNANKERRPPRASDFPALDERAGKTRKSVNARLQRGGRNEEREGENQIETISIDSGDQGWNKNQQKFAHEKRNVTSNSSGRQQQATSSSTQYKTKQRRNHGEQNNREHFERSQQQQQQQQKYSNNLTQQQQQQTKTPQPTAGVAAAMQNYANENNFNNSNNNNNNLENSTVYRLPNSQQPPQQQLLRQQQQKPGSGGNAATTTSNLQQRLQQVQSRNDPSHVGSVQMHTLATQNQMQQNQMHVMPPQQTPQQQQQQQLEQQQQQRGPPKRYSSIRDHQLQQMQQQQQQQASMLLPHEQQQQQHMLAQANLMQHLYHQEKLQAQMQALQVSQPPPPQPPTVAPGVTKPPNTYATVPGAPPATAQGYAPNNAAAGSVPAAAYYVAAPPPPEAAPYPPQAAPATNYLPTAPYGPAPAAAVPPAAPYTPPTVSATPTVVAGQPASSGNANFGNYQNYNTVGGTTYFVPPAQPPARQVVLPQRRPTNAIPILPPDSSERAKQQRGVGLDAKEDMDSAENIDHIIDNMFVARPVFQPPRKSSSPPVAGEPSEVTEEAEKQQELNVNVNVVEQQQQQQSENITTTTTGAAVAVVEQNIQE